jgi:hypothetical protein
MNTSQNLSKVNVQNLSQAILQFTTNGWITSSQVIQRMELKLESAAHYIHFCQISNSLNSSQPSNKAILPKTKALLATLKPDSINQTAYTDLSSGSIKADKEVFHQDRNKQHITKSTKLQPSFFTDYF